MPLWQPLGKAQQALRLQYGMMIVFQFQIGGKSFREGNILIL